MIKHKTFPSLFYLFLQIFFAVPTPGAGLCPPVSGWTWASRRELGGPRKKGLGILGPVPPSPPDRARAKKPRLRVARTSPSVTTLVLLTTQNWSFPFRRKVSQAAGSPQGCSTHSRHAAFAAASCLALPPRCAPATGRASGPGAGSSGQRPRPPPAGPLLSTLSSRTALIEPETTLGSPRAAPCLLGARRVLPSHPGSEGQDPTVRT